MQRHKTKGAVFMAEIKKNVEVSGLQAIAQRILGAKINAETVFANARTIAQEANASDKRARYFKSAQIDGRRTGKGRDFDYFTQADVLREVEVKS